MLKVISGIALLGTLAGCAQPEPKEPPLEGLISIASGPCLGLCPVFTMQVNPEDRYTLDGGANTIKQGASEGGLPVGAFRRALDLMDRYEFDGMRRGYTADNALSCPQQVTGTPTLTITRESKDFIKSVTYDVGCLDFAEKDNLDLLVEGLYRNFRISDLVAVGEPPKAEDQLNK